MGECVPPTQAKGQYDIPSWTVELADAQNATGTMGFFSEGRDIDIYDFTVTYPVTEVFGADNAIAPTTTDTVTVPVNTTVDLSRYDFGKALTDTRDAVGELDAANNTFTAFTVGSVTIDGVTFNVTDSAAAGGKKLVNVIGNGTAVVAPANDGKYTLTTNANEGYVVKAGAVTVDGKICALDANNALTFAVDAIGNTEITVEFIKKNELGFKSMGATIRIADENVTTGIRFGARINNIYAQGDGITMDETVVISGKEYKIKSIGSLLIPTVLLGSSELTVDTPDVADNETKKVTNYTENYADIISTLINIPKSMYGKR